MIDQLRREVEELEHLSPTEQEEMALYIRSLLRSLREMHSQDATTGAAAPDESWQDPAGAWSDLPEDDEAETFYRMRHEVPPSAAD